MTFLRGGAIGLTSGLKGGALAGGLGGAVLMALQVAAGESGVVIAYTTIVGLTTGMMGGAFVGAVVGLLLGGMTGRLWGQLPPAVLQGGWIAVIGLLSAALTAVVMRDPTIPLVVAGGGIGALGGWWSGRDFVRVGRRQKKS